MAAEPVQRVRALINYGYWIDDAVIDIDAQVARQLVVEGVVEAVPDEEDPYPGIALLPGPAGLYSSW